MLKMTDLLGNTEYVTDFKGFKRKRKANGDKTIDFTVFQSDKNKHSFNLVQEESTFEFRDFDEFTQKETRFTRDRMMEFKPFAYLDCHLIRGHKRDVY